MLSILVPTVERTVQSEHRELNLSLRCTARLLCQLILSWAPVQAVIIEQLLGEKALETPAMTWHISLWIIGSWSVLVKALIRWYSSNLIQSKFKKNNKKTVSVVQRPKKVASCSIKAGWWLRSALLSWVWIPFCACLQDTGLEVGPWMLHGGGPLLLTLESNAENFKWISTARINKGLIKSVLSTTASQWNGKSNKWLWRATTTAHSPPRSVNDLTVAVFHLFHSNLAQSSRKKKNDEHSKWRCTSALVRFWNDDGIHVDTGVCEGK